MDGGDIHMVTLLSFVRWLAVGLLGVVRDVILVTIIIPIFIFPGLLVISRKLLNRGGELYPFDWRNIWSFTKQILLLLLSLWPISWVFWGQRLVVILVVNLGRLLPRDRQIWPEDWKVSYQGDPKLPSPASKRDIPHAFFVNGICVDRNWLQLNCETLETYLDHQVKGIYNQTNGLLIDIVECVLQRNFNFYTGSVLNAAAVVEAALRAKNGKVMLIGHSQGGIIVSLVVDHLVTYCPPALLANLEVYTFASAADEFMAPAIPITVKHYANMFDVVAWIGILGCHFFCSIIAAVCGPPYGEYYGQVFMNPYTFGHLLSTFYVFRTPSVYQPLNDGDSRPF